MSELNSKHLVIFSIVALMLAIGAYYPSLFVPFYLDDLDSIVTNTRIHAASVEPLLETWSNFRLIGYLTFWFNYQLSQLEPFGFHVVNITIHLLNAVLVFIITRQILLHFKRVSNGAHPTAQWGKECEVIALLVAALWLLHPLNSQPVIYVVQRLTTIAALFMLLTVIFYLKVRSASTPKERAAFVTLLALSVLGGFFSKQNYVSIILFMFVWELYTGSHVVKRRLKQFSVVGAIALIFVAPFPFMADYWHLLDAFTRDKDAPDRVAYFYTQTIVLWDYLYRFFIPYPLQLNIDVTLRTTFEPIVALALVGHLALIMLSYFMRNKIPLFFVGVILFYCSHSVESFIIPIRDLAFEHRTYMGNIGLVMAFVGIISYLATKVSWLKVDRKSATCGVFILLFAGGFLIFERAKQWQDPIAFYQREVSLSPEHHRTNASYGNELAKNKEFERAEEYLKKAIDLYIADNMITAGVLNSYMNVLYQQKKYQQAAPVVMMGLKHIKSPLPRSTLLSNLAVGYIYMGYCDFAAGLLNQALTLNPGNANARANLEYCKKRMGL